MGFKKNQKRNQVHHKTSKINHSKLFKKKQTIIKDDANNKNEDKNNNMDIEMDSVVSEKVNNVRNKIASLKLFNQRQKISREKLLNSIRNIAHQNMQPMIKNFETSESSESLNDNKNNLTDSLYHKKIAPELSNLSSFYKEFNKVVEASDVIIEVLDARDPLGTRCEEIERAVIACGPSKKLVLLINKVDLVPTENLKEWLKYLRNEFPTIAFKASTQKQKSKLGRINKDVLNATASMLKSSKCMGANILMKILGNYCRNAGIRTAINVGIVGYPNVGKSSVINSLIRNRSCGVGSTPGLTKNVQYIHLDKKIRLLDSPGIVFAKSNDDDSEIQAANLALRNCIKIEQISDPILPVKAILARTTREDLLNYYKIENFETVEQFLLLLAKRYGKLKKGGVPDTYAAAKQILNDWNTGKIKYYTHPPDIHSLPSYISTELVTEYSKGFDIEEVNDLEVHSKDEDEIEDNTLDVIEEEHLDENIINAKEMLNKNIENLNEMEDNINSTDKMENNIDKNEIKDVLKNNTVVQFKNKKKGKMNGNQLVQASVMAGMQLNKDRKIQFKKMKKKQKRITKVSEKMSENLEKCLKLF